MTIASDVNRSGPFTGDGVATSFPFTFKVYSDEHVSVIVTDLTDAESTLVLGTDYSVSGVGEDGGGQIVLTAPLSAGYLLTVLLNVPFTQETDLENQGAYYAETVERAFDLAVMRDQQLEEQISRAVIIPASADPSYLSQLLTDILRLGASADQIDVVASIRAQVVTTAGIAANVTTVAGIAPNVTTVAGIAANVTIVANAVGNIAVIVADKANVDAVAGAINQVKAVAADLTRIDAVYADLANIDAIVADKANVDAVGAAISQVRAVGNDIARVALVADDLANVDAVAANKANVDTVAGISANVTKVANVSASVPTVAGIASDVTTVAANVNGVKNFASVYQGAKAAAPTVRPDGTALARGDMYFDTTLGMLRVYSGTAWGTGNYDTRDVTISDREPTSADAGDPGDIWYTITAAS